MIKKIVSVVALLHIISTYGMFPNENSLTSLLGDDEFLTLTDLSKDQPHSYENNTLAHLQNAHFWEPLKSNEQPLNHSEINTTEHQNPTSSNSIQISQTNIYLTIPQTFQMHQPQTVKITKKYHRSKETTKSPNKVMCSICDKILYKYSLKVHMRKHTGEQPYHCLLCNKRFNALCNALRHAKTNNEHLKKIKNPPIISANNCCKHCYIAFDYLKELSTHKCGYKKNYYFS